MTILSIIERKVQHLELTEEEIAFFIQGYVNDIIPDYQIASLLMAIKLNGMTAQETAWLTKAMVASGESVDLSSIPGIKVDKHSTGGVGDKTSLVIGPIVASLGLKLAKMSGKGLGHTGGTIDKLESIPGLTTSLSSQQFIDQVNRVGMAIIGQTGSLVPADKKLYALRDVTGTVQSIPLIASSIMSKKIASGAQTILLDVKYGNGAFMKTIEDATVLAKAMVAIGQSLGRDTRAMLSDMNEPLGLTIGNRLEVQEAIATLQGNGPDDFTELCVEAATIMSRQANLFPSDKEAEEAVRSVLSSGQALDVFHQFIRAQGGDLAAFMQPERHLTAHVIPILASTSGYVASITALTLGQLAVELGAGRLTKDDTIDPNAGIVLNVKQATYVKEGDVLCTLYTNKTPLSEWMQYAQGAFNITQTKPIVTHLHHEVIR
jgi:pyrimidine-nucleoside phosphorylase